MTIDGWDGPVHPAAEVFPLMEGDEFNDLVASIAVNGLREPIWLDADGALLDGRNRICACQKAGVKPTFRQYDGDDPVSFVVDLNIQRRHLNAGQKAMVAVELEPLYAAQAKRAQGTRTDLTTEEPSRHMAGKSKRENESAEKAAKRVGASGRSVSRAKKVKAEAPYLAEKVESGALPLGTAERTVKERRRVTALKKAAPDLAEKVASGDLAIDRAERILRDREAERRRIEQAKEDAKNRPERPNVDIRHGDFREVLADLQDVDAVITDPPYPKEYLPLLADLAAWADKVLKPDGVLAVLFGQTYLPEVYRLLDGHRPYRWTMAYLTPGPGYRSHSAQVQSNWKPVLLYGGGPRLADVLRSEAQDVGAKDLHHWGQDYGAFHTLVERLTRPGQTVVDPFAGAGTTLLAANANGCHAIGCDVDAEHVETMRRRLA